MRCRALAVLVIAALVTPAGGGEAEDGAVKAVEGLERFVRREPLRRVHECAFGVLALESEPADPRL
jgi:hypothetical protein